MIAFAFVKRIALLFFIVGTLLFFLGIIVPEPFGIFVLGLLFTVIAVLISTVLFAILLVDLIKHDRLESFFGICILLANLPIAATYFYVLTNY
ncbi:MAG: hypothetical protein HKN48_12690 [Flavobacteriaceae bacterium]|nr:hypothetical protein [Flavobacteriaceae bacterium]